MRARTRISRSIRRARVRRCVCCYMYVYLFRDSIKRTAGPSRADSLCDRCAFAGVQQRVRCVALLVGVRRKVFADAQLKHAHRLCECVFVRSRVNVSCRTVERSFSRGNHINCASLSHTLTHCDCRTAERHSAPNRLPESRTNARARVHR